MTTTEKTKYHWNYSFSWAVEFVRKDAEIAIDMDEKRIQKVILKRCSSREEAERVAVEYCSKLATKIEALILQETSSLASAME